LFRYRSILFQLIIGVCFSPTRAGARLRLSRDGREGRKLLLRQRWAAAAEAFQRAVDHGHPEPAELEGLGYTRLKAGQFPQAAQAYRVLCEKDPNKAWLWVNLGLSYAS